MISQGEVNRKVLDICKRQGLNPARLNPSRHRTIVIQAYRELGSAGKAITSATRTAAKSFIHTVSNEVASRNERICRDCEKFEDHATLGPVCTECRCSGKLLRMKWRATHEFCPLTVSGVRCGFNGHRSPDHPDDPPKWDNRKEKKLRLTDASQPNTSNDVSLHRK